MEKQMPDLQGEQTAGSSENTGKAGVCGKTAAWAALQDELTGALIGLARAVDGNEVLKTAETDQLVIKGLFTTVTNANFNEETVRILLKKVRDEIHRIVPDCSVCASPCGRTSEYDMREVWKAGEDIRSLKLLLLLGIRGVAAYAYHAMLQGYTDEKVNAFFYKALYMIGYDGEAADLLSVVLEAGKVSFQMEKAFRALPV